MQYIIDTTERGSLLMPGGRPTQGYRVWFTVPELGVVDFVEIKKDNYTPENVHAAIEALIERHISVLGAAGE